MAISEGILEAISDRGPRASRVPFCEWAAAQNVDHCIIWPFALTPHGYGRVRYKGVRTSAHRVVLEMAKGPPPSSDYVAAHAPVICHNPSCVNPRHLRWASVLENSKDRILDGTAAKSSEHRQGVSKTKNGKYRAYIYRQSKQIHLGIFDCPHRARAAVLKE